MFRTAETAPVAQVVAGRAARVGFGATLIAGALAVVQGALADTTPFGLGLAAWFALVWASAVGAGAIAWLIARRLRAHGDPDRLAVSGLVVPAIGLALMGPLSLHLTVAFWMGWLDSFDDWVQLSLWITGPAHLALAITSAVRARQLVRGTPAMSLSSLFGVVVLVSCVPFIVLYLIPPIVVAVTGLAYLPILLAQRALAERDQQLLAAAPPVARALAA